MPSLHERAARTSRFSRSSLLTLLTSAFFGSLIRKKSRASADSVIRAS